MILPCSFLRRKSCSQLSISLYRSSKSTTFWSLIHEQLVFKDIRRGEIDVGTNNDSQPYMQFFSHQIYRVSLIRMKAIGLIAYDTSKKLSCARKFVRRPEMSLRHAFEHVQTLQCHHTCVPRSCTFVSPALLTQSNNLL